MCYANHSRACCRDRYRFTQDLHRHARLYCGFFLKLLPTVFVRRLIITFPWCKPWPCRLRGPIGSFFTIYLWPGGLDVWLVDGRQTTQVPGRKTDVKDCQWIQQLHSYGLFNRCFCCRRRSKEIRKYLRLREDILQTASMHINHMNKALVEMNIRLADVLSQIHGASGMAVIEAILAGERNPRMLLSLCHSKIRKTKSKEILAALEGFYSESRIFVLRIAYDSYRACLKQIEDCDKRVEELLERINQDGQQGNTAARKPIRHNKPQIKNLGDHMLNLFQGRDATILPGITDYTWMQIYSETGE